MKTIKKEQIKKEITYPCLKESNTGLIVLFVTRTTGTVVYAPIHLEGRIGEYSSDWCESRFKEYTGQLILEN